MSGLIDITNRKQLANLLQKLRPETTPLWGKMNSQQMIEHLIEQVKYTNGKNIFVYDGPIDKAGRQKAKMLISKAGLPKNLVLEILPESFNFPDLETAIKQLMTELDDFDQYFKEPGRSADHGAYGPMNYQEWLIWHGKHFTHHFKQFALLPD